MSSGVALGSWFLNSSLDHSTVTWLKCSTCIYLKCVVKQIHYFANKDPSSQSYGFSSSHVWMWEVDYKESWAPLNWCFWTVVLEKTLESPLDCKEIQPVHPKGNQSWVFIGRTDVEAETPIFWATLCEELTHWKRPWCLERLRAGGEGGDRDWDGWMASPTRWTWVWVDSRSWWWTGRPGVLRFMGSQRVGHDWVTELNWTPHSKSKLRKICLPQPIYYFLLYLSVFNEHFNNSVYPLS